MPGPSQRSRARGVTSSGKAKTRPCLQPCAKGDSPSTPSERLHTHEGSTMTDTDDGSPRRRKAAVEPPASMPEHALKPASMLCAAPRVVLAVASMWIIWVLLIIIGGAAYAYTIYPDARFPLQLAAAALVIQLLVLIYLQPDVITDIAELYEPRIVWRARTKAKIAALTIDDVPVGAASKIEEILSILEANDARATLFVMCGEFRGISSRKQTQKMPSPGRSNWPTRRLRRARCSPVRSNLERHLRLRRPDSLDGTSTFSEMVPARVRARQSRYFLSGPSSKLCSVLGSLPARQLRFIPCATPRICEGASGRGHCYLT